MTAEELEPMLMKTIIGVGYEPGAQVMCLVLADGTEWYFQGVYTYDQETEGQQTCH